MRLKAGLGGQVVAGRTSELEIRLFAATPFDGELKILDNNGLSTLPVHLDELKAQTLWLPILAEPDTPVSVILRSDGGDVLEQAPRFVQSRAPLMIISSAIPIEAKLDGYQRPQGTTPVIISARSMPHTPQAYDSVGAVIAEPSLLSKLSQDQYHALGSYLGGCGIMLLSADMTAVLARLRGVAGCGGRFVQLYEDISRVSSSLRELMERRPPLPPSPQELLSLGQSGIHSATINAISLYLGGYLLFIALLAWRAKQLLYLTLLPLLVAGAGILAWSGNGGHRLITWAESQSADSHLRLSSLLLLGGERRGESRSRLRPDARLLNMVGATPDSGIRYQDRGRQAELHGHTDLLAPLRYVLTSQARQAPRFRLTIREGFPEIVFLGKKWPSDTRLLWRGRAYNVPKLAQAGHWRPDKSLGHSPESNEERLLNRRLAYDDPALLLPFTSDPPLLHDPDVPNRGWLVIRRAADIAL